MNKKQEIKRIKRVFNKTLKLISRYKKYKIVDVSEKELEEAMEYNRDYFCKPQSRF